MHKSKVPMTDNIQYRIICSSVRIVLPILFIRNQNH